MRYGGFSPGKLLPELESEDQGLLNVGVGQVGDPKCTLPLKGLWDWGWEAATGPGGKSLQDGRCCLSRCHGLLALHHSTQSPSAPLPQGPFSFLKDYRSAAPIHTLGPCHIADPSPGLPIPAKAVLFSCSGTHTRMGATGRRTIWNHLGGLDTQGSCQGLG